MESQDQFNTSRIEDLISQVRSLESRIAKLEGQASSVHNAPSSSRQVAYQAPEDEGDLITVDKSLIESKVGEYGMAWLGSIVLMLGISFLMEFISSKGMPLYAALMGFASAAGVFVLGTTLRKASPHILFMLNISAHLLIYYTTLRLFFFSGNPLLPQKIVVVALLIVALGVQLYFALKQKSELLAGIVIVLLSSTAMIADGLHLTMITLFVSALVSLILMYRFLWWRLFIVNMVLVYIVQLLWLFNNPFMGHPIEATTQHPYSVIYLFLCGAVFSLPALFEYGTRYPVKGVNAIILLNAVFFSLTILTVTAVYFIDHYTVMFAAISVFCILFSVALKMFTKSPFTPSFFACFGFFALSVMVYGFAKLPDAYFYLALQSFLVVSMALWFRSRIIVVMNSLLFVGLLLIYLLGANPVDKINFCFAFVAFSTARILNWKKDRLTLETDFLRNTYMFALFFCMLYACYHTFKPNYVTLSWAGTAILFFIISLVLHNVKYRWLAVGTLLATVVYLLFVDLAKLEVGYRVIAFLVLAVILFSASLYYTKYHKKKRMEPEPEIPDTAV